MFSLILVAIINTTTFTGAVNNDTGIGAASSKVTAPEVAPDDFLVISPMQASRTLNISLAYSFGETVKVELFDVLGVRVFKTAFDGPRLSFDISSLNRGVYFVKVVIGEGKYLTRRVIIY